MSEESPQQRQGRLPPLAAEDHICVECVISYAAMSIDEALATLAELPDQVRSAALAIPAGRRRLRPDPDTWSVVEYTCHVRDIFATFTIRLHRTRTEQGPALEPMFSDLRARRFRYNDRDLTAVPDDLEANVSGFRDEIARLAVGDGDRTATRLPGEPRTARWLVRQATHEGIHHVRDIQRVGRLTSG